MMDENLVIKHCIVFRSLTCSFVTFTVGSTVASHTFACAGSGTECPSILTSQWTG